MGTNIVGKMSLGDRMKNNYENRSRYKLIRRMPVILRLDGKAFHTLTKNCDRPFDAELKDCMVETALFLCSEIQGAKIAYTQSDEISILLTDFDTLTTDAWFDYNIQKMCSVTAAYASVTFNHFWQWEYKNEHTGYFDCRAFNIPKEEVCNYFIWRQKDWERNSLQMLARTFFSHKELHKKKTADIHEMLHTKGVNWTADLEDQWKNGSTIFQFGFEQRAKWTCFDDIIFKDRRELIECYLEPKEE